MHPHPEPSTCTQLPMETPVPRKATYADRNPLPVTVSNLQHACDAELAHVTPVGRKNAVARYAEEAATAGGRSSASRYDDAASSRRSTTSMRPEIRTDNEGASARRAWP